MSINYYAELNGRYRTKSKFNSEYIRTQVNCEEYMAIHSRTETAEILDMIKWVKWVLKQNDGRIALNERLDNVYHTLPAILTINREYMNGKEVLVYRDWLDYNGRKVDRDDGREIKLSDIDSLIVKAIDRRKRQVDNMIQEESKNQSA